MNPQKTWVEWVIELQGIAQTGLTYATDIYDIERYQRIREISVEMMAQIADLPIIKIKDLFCEESGYQTPKLDTRAAIFHENKILLVQENSGKWPLPGGCYDVDLFSGLPESKLESNI